MNLQEQLVAFRQKANELRECMTQLMTRAGEEGRTLDTDEQSEFEGLESELENVTAHTKRLERLVGSPAQTEVVQKGPTILVRKQDPDDKFEGQSFVRRVIARAIGKLSEDHTAASVAESRWGKSHPNLVRWIKEGIPGGSAYGTGSDSWGMELVSHDSRFTGDFVDFLAAATVYDRLPLRTVPANVSINGRDGIGVAHWVGEKQPIPMSAQSYTDVQLTAKKVAALTVVSKELLKYSDPSAEQFLRDSLVESARQRIDLTFLGTGTATASTPAGILASPLSGLTTEGNDSDGVRQDLMKLMAPFLSARNTSGLWLVMNPALASTIGMMFNALGAQEFAGITENGGTLHGKPVITGDNVNAAHVILLSPSDIWRIGDTGVEVSLSMDATIEMDDTPVGEGSGPTGQGENAVNMFQTEQVAFKIVRALNFQKRRPSAVQFISNAAYEAGTS